MQRFTTQGTRLLDEHGRECIFHGVNLKDDKMLEEPPYGRLEHLDEEFFRRSQKLGFRLLRLGLMWAYIEPEKGQYNEAYLQKIDEVFALAAKYDIYIMLDMHQDLYSDFGKGNALPGKGMPYWACLTDQYEAKPQWFVWSDRYYLDKAVHRAFDHFWANDKVLGKGLQEHLAEAWQTLARRYANQPAFFGFDLLNEPFPGTPGGKIFRKLVAKLVRVCGVSPSVHRIQFLKTALNKERRGYALDVLTPTVMGKVTKVAAGLVEKFDKEHYAPFVARMIAALREITPNGVILLEHNYWCNLGIPFRIEPPAGEAIVYSPHGYDFLVDTPAYQFASNERTGFMFGQMAQNQAAMNVPVIVGEWGGGGEGEGFFPHISHLLDFFEARNWSNTYFTYTPGFYDQPIMRVLARPYPRAVNGTIGSFAVDTERKIFTLDYTPRDEELPTEIYLPNGYDNVEAGKGARVEYEGTVLKITERSGRIVVHYN
ncbi:MAG: cellulase family glycosylhydrolase [Oscillospiraceae bacterium]|jgi:endoglycosylceramidase|nr:cellulase family glycosylhydrolase [Oscillospiraceae bacterium]